MKEGFMLLIVGIIILSFALYQYLEPKPPSTTFIPFTTTKQTKATTTTEFKLTTTTTLFVYVTKATLPKETTTTKPATTTTTLIPASCLNKELDSDEEYIDCAPKCGNCKLINLTNGYFKYPSDNLWIKLDSMEKTTVVGGPCEDNNRVDTGQPGELLYHCFNYIFHLSLKTTEIMPDQRDMILGEIARVDGMEIKAISSNISSNSSNLIVVVKKDYNTLKLTPEYMMLTVGGKSCGTNRTGFCTRTWYSYSFELKEREKSKARMIITTPAGKRNDVWISQGDTLTIEGAKIGLLYPYEKGGYAIIYVKKQA